MKTTLLLLYCLVGGVWLGILTTLVRSAITPGTRYSRTWYDRTIRLVGAVQLGLIALFGLVMTLTHTK